MDLQNRLLYTIETLGLDKLDGIALAQQKVDLNVKYSTKSLHEFESALKAATASGLSYGKSLQDIARYGGEENKVLREIAKTLLDNDRAQRAATAAAERESRKRIEVAERESRAIANSLKNVNVLAGVKDARSLDSLIGRVAGGAAVPILGGVAAAGFTANLVRGAAEQARQLQDLADKFGVTAQQAFKFDAAAKLSGQTMAALSSSAKRLEDALSAPGGAGKKTAEELIKLGVSLNQNLGSALEQTLQRLADIPDAGQRSAAALRIFGENGAKIAEVAGNLKNVRQALEDDVQKKLLEASRVLADMDNQWTILKGKMAAGIVGTIQVVSQTLSNVGASTEASRYGANVEGSALTQMSSIDRSLLNRVGTPGGGSRPGAPSAPPIQRGDVSSLRRLLTPSGNSPDAIAFRLSDVQTRLRDAEVRAQGTVANGASPQMISIQRNELASLRAEEARLKAMQRGPRVENQYEREMSRIAEENYRNTHPSSVYGRIPELQAQMVDRVTGFSRDTNLSPAQRRNLIAAVGKQGTADIAFERGRLSDAELQRQQKAGAISDEFNRDAFGIQNKGIMRDQRFQFGESLRDAREDFVADRTLVGIQRTSGVGAVTRQLGFQQRLSTITGGGQETAGTIGRGLNNEIAIAQMTAQTRRQAIEDSKDLYNDQQKRIELARVEADLTKQTDEARLSAAERLIELNQRQHQETGNFTAGLANAAMDGNVGGFFRSFGRQQISTIAGNFGKNLPFTLNSVGSLGGTGMLGTAEKPSFLGKMLQGTPFGLDPGKAANPGIDTNTVATVANTGATQALTSVIASISGVSPAAIAAAGGGVSGGLPSSIGSIGGLTGTPPFLANQLLSNADIGIPRASSGMVLPNIGGAGGASGGYAGAGGIMQQIMGGAGSVLSGQALNSVLYGGTKDASGAWTSSTGMERLGAGIGLGASTAGGVLGAISGFKSGGGRGITKGLASSLAAAAPFAGPAAPFLAGGAAITGLISSLFPDPRKQRMEQMENTLTGAAYIQPSSRAYSFGNGGGSGFSYGEGGSIMAGGPRTQAPVVNLNVSALDAKSMVGYFQDNSAQFGQALLYGMQNSGVSALGAQMNLMTGGSGW
jgi:hypothetical protein